MKNIKPNPVFNKTYTMEINQIIPVIFINLDRATERLEKIQAMFTEYGFTNVIRLSAVDIPQSPFLGCAISHLLALKMAKERGFQQVLIMEDDLEILLPPDEFWEKMKRVPEDFDVFHLVAKVYSCQILKGNELARIHEASNSAGYIVRGHYYDVMIETMEQGNSFLQQTGDHHSFANDRSWRYLQRTGKWFYFVQLIAQQRQNIWSYISNSYTSN